MHTEIKVYPKNWEKNIKSNLKKEWYVYYEFNGKHIRFRGGLNYCKTLVKKQELTRQLVADELRNLKNGFNPITKEYSGTKDINPDTVFISAIKLAVEKVKVADSTRRDMKIQIAVAEKCAANIGITGKEIGTVRRRDIALLLDNVLDSGYSNDKYNKVRTTLSILFKYFVKLDIFEDNFIRNIEKQPHHPERREIYTPEDIEKLKIIKQGNYRLWRFLVIFHASQSRIIEMRELKIENINYQNQTFKVFQKKGKTYQNIMKPINIHTAPLWKELLSEVRPGDIYLFGNDLKPSPEPLNNIRLDGIFKYWRKKAGITKSLYSLRHTFANFIANEYGIGEAQKALGHTNQKTTEIYAVDYRENLVKEQVTLKTAITL